MNRDKMEAGLRLFLEGLVDGLPISLSGLGTRENVLLFLLQPERPAHLVACTILWWSAMILGRATIGLGALWLPRLWGATRQPLLAKELSGAD